MRELRVCRIDASRSSTPAGFQRRLQFFGRPDDFYVHGKPLTRATRSGYVTGDHVSSSRVAPALLFWRRGALVASARPARALPIWQREAGPRTLSAGAALGL